MKYIKIINGQTYIKPLKDIILYKNNKQIINPTEEMVLEDGWEKYITPSKTEPTEEEFLEQRREELINKINQYDNSEAINSCTILYSGNSMNYWADKNERSSLKTAIQDSITLGRETYRLDLRDAGFYMNINCENLLYMLSSLEVYAIDCYNKTTDHIFAVKSLQSIEEIEAYDYTVGYPEKLTFNIE